MVGKGNKNENVRSSEGCLTKYPFLLDYSIGGKKKNWFRSILYPRSIVFLLVDSMLNVNTLQIEITCTLSVDNIFFSWKTREEFRFFFIHSLLRSSFFLELNWPEILFAAIVYPDKQKSRKEMFLSFATPRLPRRM